jgi:hypothetical protein
MSIKKELQALPTDAAALRKFGLTVGLVFAAIGLFLRYREVSWALAPLAPLAVGGLLVIFGVVAPKLLKGVYLGWMTFALVLGSIMTRILLTIFFFVVLTPFGLLFRVIGRDALTRRPDRKAATYWLPKEYPIPDRTRFEKFF